MTTTNIYEESSALIKKTDWFSPVTIMTLATIGLGFFAGGHFMKIGLFLACGMSLSILILLKKSPWFVKEWCYYHPLAADLILSSLATWGVAAFFGQGLTLGISAITTAVILSWGIPAATKGAILEDEETR